VTHDQSSAAPLGLPATHTRPSSSPSPVQRITAAVRWIGTFLRQHVESDICDTCSDCGRPCERVFDAPSAERCAGTRHVAQCADCVFTVPVRRDERGVWVCVRNKLHVIARVSPASEVRR
jgi:hypothetical protein